MEIYCAAPIFASGKNNLRETLSLSPGDSDETGAGEIFALEVSRPFLCTHKI